MNIIAQHRGLTLAVQITALLAVALILALVTSSFVSLVIVLLALIILRKSIVRVMIGSLAVLEGPGEIGIGLLTKGLQVVPWPLRVGPTLGLMPESYQQTIEAPTAEVGVCVQIELILNCGQALPTFGSADSHQVFNACMVKAYARPYWERRRDIAIKTAVCQAVRRFYPDQVLGQSEAFIGQLTQLLEASLALQGAKLLEQPVLVPSLAPSARHLQRIYIQATSKAVNDRIMRQRVETLSQTIAGLREHLTPQQATAFYMMQHHTASEGSNGELAELLLMREWLHDGVATDRNSRNRVIDLSPMREDDTHPYPDRRDYFRCGDDRYDLDDDER